MRRVKLLDSYTGGIVDGEGAVTLVRGTSGYYQCRLSVSNTCKELLEQVRATYGGSPVQAMKAHPRYKQAYVWCLNGQAAAPVLRKLLPFLIVKREHAKIALEFLETCTCGSGKHLTEEQFEHAERLALAMKAINMKGPQ